MPQTKRLSNLMDTALFSRFTVLGFSLSACTATHASVTINTNAGNGFYVNDDDPGLYVNNGKTSTRMQEDDAFRMPVAQDGSPRWSSCTSMPCPQIPTLDKAPGEKGRKSVRKLTKEEIDLFLGFKPVVKLSPAIQKLKESMLSTRFRLDSVTLSTLQEAFLPVVDSLGPAMQNDTSNQLVRDAEEAIRLKDALYSFWSDRINSTRYASGVEITNCKILETGVKNFNQVAGTEAVVYTYKGGPLSWMVGNSVCRYTGGIESAMINRIQAVLKRNTASDSSFSIKRFQANTPIYYNNPNPAGTSQFGR